MSSQNDSTNAKWTAQSRMHSEASIIKQLPFLLIYPLRGYASFIIPIFSLMLWITVSNIGGLLVVILVSTM